MKTHDVPRTPTATLIAFSAWLKQVGRSDTTGWRWVRAGWLSPINICGKPYLSAEDIAQFVARARAGEFARRPAGAASRSAAARAARETTEIEATATQGTQ